MSADRSPQWVGRATLWSVSLMLVGLVSCGLASMLWLTTPLAHSDEFTAAYRFMLAATLAAGLLAFLMLFFVHNWFIPPRDYMYGSLRNARVHVGLTAFDDEEAIGLAVREFKACPEVDRVVVVDNNSADGTSSVAIEAGADEVVVETTPGYGSCCIRAMAEAARGADVIILCEGDVTFSAEDVKKFLAYLENADMVLGTRATQELRAARTQMDRLINPGNQIVAKLIQARFWGTRLTDVGCTYRAIRTRAYSKLQSSLIIKENHFSSHMIIESLKIDLRIIEIPVVFRARVGRSKGVGSNKLKAAKVALKVLGLIYRA